MARHLKSFALASAVLLAACSTGSEDLADTAAAEAPLVSDASSMIQRPDGRWDVVCKNGRTEVVTTAQILANDVCGTTLPTRCVRNCTSRYSDGTCRQYGADYCAPGATCVPNVVSRYSDGSAREYGPDFCTSGPAECKSRCTSRYSDGTCRTYGADMCGPPGAGCVPRCSARYSDGTCRDYAEDFCKRELPAPACLVNCTSRYPDGTCRTYGADICQ